MNLVLMHGVCASLIIFMRSVYTTSHTKNLKNEKR